MAGKKQRFWPSLISPLSARILAIMLLPLALFFIGLFSIDQYRSVLVRAEFDALERQGMTLARSLALAEADRTGRLVATRELSPQTMRHLLPLVGYGSQLRARVFQPQGQLMADTFRRGDRIPMTRIRRREPVDFSSRFRVKTVGAFNQLADLISNRQPVPVMNLRGLRHADGLYDVRAALSGDTVRNMWRNPRGQLVLAVSLPIQNLRVVRGALLMTSTGGNIEREIANVQWAFVQLFMGILTVTILLGLYLARSITRPIVFLAASADRLRQTGDIQTPLRGLPERKDEIGQLSQALSDMTAELQRRIQATAKFAADVSHEIKNPLTSLRSAVETVARIDNPEQQRKLMDVILADVDRLDRLITDISHASRVDAELTGQTPEPEDLSALLNSWVEVSRQRYSQKGDQNNDQNNIQEKLVYKPYKKPLMVRMYATRIIQILDNLLANAMTFHNSDQPIVLSVGRSRGQVHISLADKGPGLPAGKEERIFDRFYTERPSSEGFGHHSGLGLSIARQIAIAHGGQLVGKNDKSGGAIFTLTLPLADKA